MMQMYGLLTFLLDITFALGVFVLFRHNRDRVFHVTSVVPKALKLKFWKSLKPNVNDILLILAIPWIIPAIYSYTFWFFLKGKRHLWSKVKNQFLYTKFAGINPSFPISWWNGSTIKEILYFTVHTLYPFKKRL
jgi:hypothetical protein